MGKAIGYQAQRARNIVPILGCNVDSTTLSLVLEGVEASLSLASKKNLRLGSGKLITTPNPEILLLASYDKKLASIINSSYFALPDGVGVLVAMSFLKYRPKLASISLVLTSVELFMAGLWFGFGTPYARTVPGRLVFRHLMILAIQKGWKVFLVGGTDGVAGRVVEKYLQQTDDASANFRILASDGPVVTMEGLTLNKSQRELEARLINDINRIKPDLLFIGYGAPKQEKWLARNLLCLNCRFAMVVGGAFDYEAGKFSEPPDFLQKNGFEWLWRMVTQPTRIRRIFNAVVVFPWKIYLSKLKDARSFHGVKS